MTITITPNIPSAPVSAPSAPAAGIVLQAGQVITAEVVQVLSSDQVQIAIGSQTITAATQVPLQAGQTLQLQVSQTANGIGLAIVNQPSTSQAGAAGGQGTTAVSGTSDAVTLAPTLAASLAATPPGAAVPANSLTPAETLAVTLAAQTAALQQTSLAPLFANLGVAAELNLPPQVQQAIVQVLAQQTNLDQNLAADAVKQAFQSSGLFLETTLASGSALSPGGVPDLKAALIVLRQTLSTSLQSPEGTPTATPQPAVTASQAGTATNPAVSDPAAEPAALGSISPGTTAGAAPQGAAQQVATQPGTPPVAGALVQAGELAGALPVTIITEAAVQEVLTSAPSIVPQLTNPAGTPGAAAQSATPGIAAEILELAAGSPAAIPTATPADAAGRAAASGTALTLLQEAVQSLPLAVTSPSQFVFENGQALSLMPVIAGMRTLDDAEVSRTNLPPPPISGALPSAQPVAPATLAAHLPVEATLQHLLDDTDGAIARQTLLQIASLPGQADPSATRVDLSTPRWNFEIPFATPQGTAMAQFEIARDGGGREPNAAKPVWRARFSLNVEPAGPVHALVSLNGDRTSVRMWAERPATASQLRAGVSQLTQALSRAELKPGDIVVRDGAPSQSATAPAGHFLDRAL
jgi:hypothetical protein